VRAGEPAGRADDVPQRHRRAHVIPAQRRGDHARQDAQDAAAVLPIHERRGINPSADAHAGELR